MLCKVEQVKENDQMTKAHTLKRRIWKTMEKAELRQNVNIIKMRNGHITIEAKIEIVTSLLKQK